MAQDSKYVNAIDVDNTVINPSPQRVRNILTLEERVAVIRAYEHRPMYTKVARMFNCSWEQIKNIITNRDAIMEFFEASRNLKRQEFDAQEEIEMDLKQRKIRFLGECVYECIQRLQYHAKLPITEELIRLKALEFQDLLRLDDFAPNKKWLNFFKATYNFSLSNKKISIYCTPSSSLDLKDIMTYCTKVRATRTSKSLLTKYNKFDVKTAEYESRRLRKLNFLLKALNEYLLRAKFHHKSMKLDNVSMREVTMELNEILKVQDFEPSLEWIEKFKEEHDKQYSLTNVKRPSFSLDLKDILSYCSRMDNKDKATTVTLAPKDTGLQMRIIPKFPGTTVNDSGLKFQQNTIIYLDEEDEKDIKPDIEEVRVERSHLEQPSPLKIRKIESINNDPELQRKFQTNSESIEKPLVCIRKQNTQPGKTYNIRKFQDNSPKENVDCIKPKQNVVFIKPKENIVCIKTQVPNIQIKEEKQVKNNIIVPSNTIIKRLAEQPTSTTLSSQTSAQQQNTSLLQDECDEELPRHVANFRDVLLLLKPLEEYAMLKENYRAIGLITQLEEVLKHEPETTSTADEEFIG